MQNKTKNEWIYMNIVIQKKTFIDFTLSPNSSQNAHILLQITWGWKTKAPSLTHTLKKKKKCSHVLEKKEQGKNKNGIQLECEAERGVSHGNGSEHKGQCLMGKSVSQCALTHACFCLSPTVSSPCSHDEQRGNAYLHRPMAQTADCKPTSLLLIV